MARPRQFEEAAVVQAAMEVFWRQGYEPTSIQDLVEATGLQRGSLYGAFKDKHGLYLAALDAYAVQMLEQIRGHIEAVDDPVEGIRGFIRTAGQRSQDEAWASRGCLVGNTCSERVAHDEAARARVEAFVGELRGVLADGLRRGQALGTFDPDRDPDAVATFVQCSLQGLSLLAKSRPGPEVVDGVIQEVLRALGRP